jgi:hypothetical protein
MDIIDIDWSIWLMMDIQSSMTETIYLVKMVNEFLIK